MEPLRTGLRSRTGAINAGMLKAAALTAALASAGIVAAQTRDAGRPHSFGPPPGAPTAIGPSHYQPHGDAAAYHDGGRDIPAVAPPFRADDTRRPGAAAIAPTFPPEPRRTADPPIGRAHAFDAHPTDFGANPNDFYGVGNRVADVPRVEVRPVPARPIPPGQAKAGKPRHPHGAPPGHVAGRGRPVATGRPRPGDHAAPPRSPLGLLISFGLAASRSPDPDASHDRSERPAGSPVATGVGGRDEGRHTGNDRDKGRRRDKGKDEEHDEDD